VLQCVAVCYSMLQCVAACYSVLQSVAVCCSVLQCVAVCCSVGAPRHPFHVTRQRGASIPRVCMCKGGGCGRWVGCARE